WPWSKYLLFMIRMCGPSSCFKPGPTGGTTPVAVTIAGREAGSPLLLQAPGSRQGDCPLVRAPHLTTGEEIRQPGQSQIGGCTCRIPLDISVFRLFPASRSEADPVRAR
uniref:Uncharacterized protein n=1 Tax=Chlorocebus sabaeus TaxID=60711 RepID=A0A0D9S905_CHLSB